MSSLSTRDVESAPSRPTVWDPPRSKAGVTTPERLGRYVILDRVGAGMMGVVYGAYDPQLDRRVAIKVLHERKARSGAVLGSSSARSTAEKVDLAEPCSPDRTNTG